MQGKLIIFSAPSGSGKTTIVRHLLGLNLGLEFSISATSRQPRNNEKDGVDYYFLSPEAFRKKIANNAFLEWEEVYKNQYYGTLRSEVHRLRAAGKHVVFDIDVVGGLNLKKEFKHEALAVFIRPPSMEIMEIRLRQRATDTEDQLTIRLNKAREELLYAEKFDHVILNDDLDSALTEAEKVVKNFINF
ncbi:MAG: guanylate kinase [Bacteroidales bacterium]|nr:guanylate kinase [Bacteroidales bacterium]